MSKFFLNPFFAPIFIVVYIGVFFLWYKGRSAEEIFLVCDTTTEVLTYICYLLSFVVIVYFFKEFKGKERKTYIICIVFWFFALFREMGIQHWLATEDSTAFKIGFFTNKVNPLSEKILSAFILLTVLALVIYMLYKWTIPIIKGFFKFDAFYWTICFLGGLGVVSKIIDRLPANLRHEGCTLTQINTAYMELFEEVSESILPILFAFAIMQFVSNKKRKKLISL